MPFDRLHAELQQIGDVRDYTSPGGAPAFRVTDGPAGLTIVASCLADGRLFTVEIERDQVGPAVRKVSVLDIDLFNQPADEVLDAIAAAGLDIDDEDSDYPTALAGQLRFDRAGGDDADEQGIAPRFISVLLVPADYETRYTRTSFPGGFASAH
jgi:hypothetical protein